MQDEQLYTTIILCKWASHTGYAGANMLFHKDKEPLKEIQLIYLFVLYCIHWYCVVLHCILFYEFTYDIFIETYLLCDVNAIVGYAIVNI